MLHDTKDAVIVRTSIDLAQRLGLRAVAEGVEDDATWRALHVLDCDAAQGDPCSRPLPAAAAARPGSADRAVERSRHFPG